MRFGFSLDPFDMRFLNSTLFLLTPYFALAILHEIRLQLVSF